MWLVSVVDLTLPKPLQKLGTLLNDPKIVRQSLLTHLIERKFTTSLNIKLQILEVESVYIILYM